ncbi:Cell division trigger factor [hydrothermal vent metagenome]|uniref:peptidylprolyl isomerase n=1 Tax=hydrothermal vent metagenome TaxID=652676 RepID=A0A3B0WM14_9ZZZZ
MQVSVEAGEGLERKLTVQVPAETVEMEVNNRLNSIKSTVRIDGFRPGKVPLKVVKQKYSGTILQEVAGELMQKTFQEALTQENLQPAGDPVIQTQDLVLGQAMEYTATFEVYPDVALTPVTDISIEKIEAGIEDSDVDNMIDVLRKQKMDWVEVDRASVNDDRISIDFIGSVNGEKFDGGSANDMPLVLGAGQMIPGFEEHLTDLKATEETSFKVSFPDDYTSEELAGKEAEFAVTVKKVEEAQLPEVDETFAKAFGVESGDVAQLKTDIKANMERELERRLRTLLKGNVMDALMAANTIDVPTATIQQEAEALMKQAEAQTPDSNLSIDTFMDDAKRRVQLGMILAEVAKTSAINIEEDMIKQRIEEMAKDYDDPDEFVRYYMGNQELLGGVQSLVLEDKVVDWIAEQATVNTKVSTFDEVMNPETNKS